MKDTDFVWRAQTKICRPISKKTKKATPGTASICSSDSEVRKGPIRMHQKWPCLQPVSFPESLSRVVHPVGGAIVRDVQLGEQGPDAAEQPLVMLGGSGQVQQPVLQTPP